MVYLECYHLEEEINPLSDKKEYTEMGCRYKRLMTKEEEKRYENEPLPKCPKCEYYTLSRVKEITL